ncbi:MAG: glycoside hydrolase family 15 protein [Parachlamydiales bacterium]|nr:glycoside hydrolase family 15 protein [Parachlamydiales bacterium]
MPRDIPIGNGRVLVAFDCNGLLRELHFPHVGQENHSSGDPFRIGVWVNGSFSWIPENWQVERDYSDDTLVASLRFANDTLRIESNDLVDFEEDIYLKKIKVLNLTDEPKEVRLFFSQDFHIYGNDIGDTAAYKPENKSLVHYKGERYFLINIFANNMFGIQRFATGNEGTWKDAEDGELGGNPIAQGRVDSVISIPLTLPPKGIEECYYWIAIGKNWEEVKRLNDIVKKKTPEEILRRTSDYWKLWSDKERLNAQLLPEKVAWLYKRSLLVCRTQMNNCGSIIAANDSDAVFFNRDTYSYMWPRDGALVAYGLDLAGYEMSQFYRFCAQILEKEGYFLHKYTPSGSLGSSWHPWEKNNKAQLPIQEDETALVIWALWNHYQCFRDLDLIRSLYHPLIKKAADFMMNYRDLNTGLPLPSFDLWEERQGVLTFTVSTVIGSLTAAAHFAEAFGETTLAQEYRSGADGMREAMEKYLWMPKEKRFARMINFQKDGTIDVDASIDASLYALFKFGVYPADHEKVASTMSQVFEKLEINGGIARYENDAFYRQENGPSNTWFVSTLWKAQYLIAKAKNRKELDQALPIFQWVADHAFPSGVLSEQINPQNNEPLSVSPLTWSHGTYIAAIQEYLIKLIHIEMCPACKQPKYSKKR